MDLQMKHSTCTPEYVTLGSCDAAMASMQAPSVYLPPILPHIDYTQSYEYHLHRSYRSGSVSDDSVDVDDTMIADAMRVMYDDPLYMSEFNVDEIADELLTKEVMLQQQSPSEEDYTCKVEPTQMLANTCSYKPVDRMDRLDRMDMGSLSSHIDGFPLTTSPPPSPTESSLSTSTNCSTNVTCHSKPTHRKKAKKGTSKYTLPDFMCQTIMDKEFNPKVIKWLNEEERVFLIVKPKIIAQLWGERKGNPKMNYPSMSRGIRERRKYGYFDRVPQDARYPKKLTYKFGPMVAQFLNR